MARKLAVLLHRLWVTGEVYERFRQEPTPPSLEAPAKKAAAKEKRISAVSTLQVAMA
jgi:hypothetical protein